jgi:C4-dicarboxylate-specific signal transduction histidine kinase
LNPALRFFNVIKNQPRGSLLVLVLLLLVGVLGAFLQGKNTALERLELMFDRSSVNRMNLLQRDLQNPLLVPEVLATSPTVRALLAHPGAVAVNEQNKVFEEAAGNAQVDVISRVHQLIA